MRLFILFLYIDTMRHAQLSRLCPVLIFTAMVFLAGCSTLPQTVPVAVIYDRDRDEFHVEVIEAPNSGVLVYPDTLRFRTLIDGERYGGLVPPSTHYEENGRKFMRLWAAPVFVYREDANDTEWHIERKKVMVSKEQKPDTHLMHTVHIYNADSTAYPVYFIHIEHVRFIVESITP